MSSANLVAHGAANGRTLLPVGPLPAHHVCRSTAFKRQKPLVLGIRAPQKCSTQSSAIAEPSSKEQSKDLVIDVDNNADENCTVVKVTGLNKPGLLSALTKTIQNLGLEVVKVSKSVTWLLSRLKAMKSDTPSIKKIGYMAKTTGLNKPWNSSHGLMKTSIHDLFQSNKTCNPFCRLLWTGKTAR